MLLDFFFRPRISLYSRYFPISGASRRSQEADYTAGRGADQSIRFPCHVPLPKATMIDGKEIDMSLAARRDEQEGVLHR